MRPRSRRSVLTGLAAAGSVGLAGCLSVDGRESASPDDPPDGTGELGEPTEAVTVTATSTPMPAFEPRIVHVTTGGTVTWRVEDGRHDVTAYHPETHGDRRIPEEAEPWQSSQLFEGNTFERTFEVEGVYDYADTRLLCTSHEVVGAIGRVVVGDPDLDAETAMKPPGEELPNQAARRVIEFNERTREALGDG